MANKYTPIKNVWVSYLGHEAQGVLNEHSQKQFKVLRKFAKKMNNKFFVYHNTDTGEILFYDICTVPDNDVKIVIKETTDKLKSSVVNTYNICISENFIRYKLTEAIYDRKCNNVIIPASYSKDFSISDIEHIKLFKSYRDAREYYYKICEVKEIGRAVEKIEAKYDKKRNAV